MCELHVFLISLKYSLSLVVFDWITGKLRYLVHKKRKKKDLESPAQEKEALE